MIAVRPGQYRLAALPVTQAQYAEVTGRRPSTAHGDRLPVEGVSWLDAVRFCNALSGREELAPAYRDAGDIEWDASADGYRLPTAAEWEHACRAGTTGPRYGPLDEIAWHRGNSDGRTHDVGGKQPNAWGLYDMLGNVWEWCWDVYDAEVYGSYRVLRGGGWFDDEWSCRASVRRRSHPTFQIDDVGFRVARSITTAGRRARSTWTTSCGSSSWDTGAAPATACSPRNPASATGSSSPYRRLVEASHHPDAREALRGGLRTASEMLAGERDIWRALHSMAKLDEEAVGGAVARREEERAAGMARIAGRLHEQGHLRPGSVWRRPTTCSGSYRASRASTCSTAGAALPLDAVVERLAETAERALMTP